MRATRYPLNVPRVIWFPCKNFIGWDQDSTGSLIYWYCLSKLDLIHILHRQSSSTLVNTSLLCKKQSLVSTASVWKNWPNIFLKLHRKEFIFQRWVSKLPCSVTPKPPNPAFSVLNHRELIPTLYTLYRTDAYLQRSILVLGDPDTQPNSFTPSIKLPFLCDTESMIVAKGDIYYFLSWETFNHARFFHVADALIQT